MEKRKLSALPRPEATAEMVEMADRLDGMEHIVTAELVDDNKILLLNFYEVSKLKKGKTEAAFRTFLSSDDYITQDLSQSKVKWLTAAFDNMQGFRLWEYKWDQKTWKSEHIPKVFIWTAEDKSIMENFFKAYRKETDENVWNAIDRFQDKKAAAEKLRREKLAAKRMEQTKKAMEEIFSKNDGVDAFQIKGKGLILVVPQSGDEIRKEGEALHHCVGGYVERVAKGETNIFFVRKADHPEQSYFTMEWKNNKVVQCRGKSNCGMPPDVKAFVQVFEKKMQDAIQKGDTNGKKKQNLQSA